jgi:general secretion pathway protein G
MNCPVIRTVKPTTIEGEDGFSLIELMVVLVILGLLATVVVINVLPAADQANATKVRADVSVLESAIEQYRLDNMSYPPNLQALVSPPAGLSRAERYRSGGYIRRLPDDPWGNAYQLTVPGIQSGGPYDVFTLGADGQPGGEAEDADIGNW